MDGIRIQGLNYRLASREKGTYVRLKDWVNYYSRHLHWRSSKDGSRNIHKEILSDGKLLTFLKDRYCFNNIYDNDLKEYAIMKGTSACIIVKLDIYHGSKKDNGWIMDMLTLRRVLRLLKHYGVVETRKDFWLYDGDIYNSIVSDIRYLNDVAMYGTHKEYLFEINVTPFGMYYCNNISKGNDVSRRIDSLTIFKPKPVIFLDELYEYKLIRKELEIREMMGYIDYLKRKIRFKMAYLKDSRKYKVRNILGLYDVDDS